MFFRLHHPSLLEATRVICERRGKSPIQTWMFASLGLREPKRHARALTRPGRQL